MFAKWIENPTLTRGTLINLYVAATGAGAGAEPLSAFGGSRLHGIAAQLRAAGWAKKSNGSAWIWYAPGHLPLSRAEAYEARSGVTRAGKINGKLREILKSRYPNPVSTSDILAHVVAALPQYSPDAIKDELRVASQALAAVGRIRGSGGGIVWCSVINKTE